MCVSLSLIARSGKLCIESEGREETDRGEGIERGSGEEFATGYVSVCGHLSCLSVWSAHTRHPIVDRSLVPLVSGGRRDARILIIRVKSRRETCSNSEPNELTLRITGRK